MQQCDLTPAPSGFMRGQTAGWGEGEGNRGGGGGEWGDSPGWTDRRLA